MKLFNRTPKKVEDPLERYSEEPLLKAIRSLPFEIQIFGESEKLCYHMKPLLKTHRALYDQLRQYNRIVDGKIIYSIVGNMLFKTDPSIKFKEIKPKWYLMERM